MASFFEKIDKIEEQERVLSNARKRFMTDEIDAEDFKAVKLGCNEVLRVLEAKLTDMPNKIDSSKSVEGLLDIIIDKYSNIHQHYKTATISDKWKLIGSMYPQNLCYDGTEHRTPYLNHAIALILLINSNLSGIKKGEKPSFVTWLVCKSSQ